KERIERLCAGGAVFAAVPLEALLGTAFDDSTAKAAASGGARLAGGIGAKIAAGAAAGAIAVGVPVGISIINDKNGLGDYRPDASSVSGGGNSSENEDSSVYKPDPLEIQKPTEII
ncbi:MAG: hypothetical protein IJ555_13880, partial [Ruminococcus sp.]|nr:hypothetical protein [Ruminococcus sp.]